MSRADKSIRNIAFALFGHFVNMVISFASRKVFLSVLSIEYLGLSSLFSNVLTLLSLTELGIGSALIYFLYQPLADKDSKKISTLMSVYKRIYTTIGVIILTIGVLLTPLMPLLIKELPDIPGIYLFYIMYVANSALSYFYIYKRELIIADQARYIYSTVNSVVKVVLLSLQIVVLVITKSFFLYLMLLVLATIIENIIISYIATKRFPFLKNKSDGKLTLQEKREIKRKIIGSSYHKIGDVFVSGTGNIILSKFVGLIETGMYANYLIIINTLNTVMTLVYQSIIASIGNLSVDKDTNKTKETFLKINFLTSWVYGFMSACLLVLLNPFISIWIGANYVFSQSVVILIISNFYIVGMRRPIAMMRDALGLFQEDKYKVIPEILVCLIVSIYATIQLGVSGILLGLISSTILTSFWTYPYVLYKYGFKTKVHEYFIKYSVYTITNILLTIAAFYVCRLFEFESFLYLFVCFFITLMLFTSTYIMLFRKTQEFQVTKMFLRFLRGKGKKHIQNDVDRG